MLKSPNNNNIQQETVPVEEPLDDRVAIVLGRNAKTEMIVIARRHRDARGRPLTVSEWGRKVLMAALADDRRNGGDRRQRARETA